jgi:hypothetical protein
MDDTLVVKVDEPFENLGDVNRNEVLGELAKALADVVKRAVLAVSSKNVLRVSCSGLKGKRGSQNRLEDDVETFTGLDVALVFHNIRMLGNI